MQPGDAIATIIKRILTLEPEHALKIIGYILFQDFGHTELIRLAFCPALHYKSSPRNEFLDFSRNPYPLYPSLTRNTLGYYPNFHDGSSQQQQWSNHFPIPRFWVPGYQFPPGGLALPPSVFGPPSERISPNQQQRMIATHGSPVSNIQGSGQFGIEGGFGSPSEQQRMIAPQFMGDFGSRMSNRQGSRQFGVQGRQERRYPPASHQIFLTFPPESSFTDQHVSTYFGNFGPVLSVRIPNQKERVYGFVSFANAETVTTILDQENPHLIGESPVNVAAAATTAGVGWREPFSVGNGPKGAMSRPRRFRNETHEMLQRNTEQADPQQAIEVEDQIRRLSNLQLPGMENKSIHHHQPSPSIGSHAHFPSQVREGGSGTGEKDLEQVETNNEEHQGQEKSLENTLPDSSFGSTKESGETRQTESDIEETKKASLDQSA
ncbi:putative RNA recognition motif domain, nucleotide-binding alpha-beta plait domain superfamily [Arabidopsis thaliana]